MSSFTASLNLSSQGTNNRMTWSFSPAANVFLLPFAVVLNGLVLFLFATKRDLQSAFNIYLANLALCNLLYAVLASPMDILASIYPHFMFGNNVCTYYLYTSYLFATITAHCHLLITINRIWAVAFPYSYAHRDSRRTAVLMCLAPWIYLNIGLLPGIVLDAIYYRIPIEEIACIINVDALRTWRLFQQFVLFDTVNVFIPCAYPYLWYRRRKVIGRVDASNSRSDKVASHPTSGSDGASREQAISGPERTVARGNKRAFMVLTALTVSTVICWTPPATLFSIGCFVDISGWTVSFIVTKLLFAIQPVLDPILFTIVLPDLRHAVKTCFTRA